MPDEKNTIQNVSDTAFWVAHYRALEGDRPDALFRDPFAKLLVDERAAKIADSMKATSAHTRQNVLIRTVIIDRYIQGLIAKGVDTVVNLGAGLDTRPYRLQLPSTLRWIEIDYPHLIEFKSKQLQNEKSLVQLERISLDLSEREKRKVVFHQINEQAKNVLVITEGVLPYLTEDQVSTLAEDLRAQNHFQYWIADYLSPLVYRFLQSKARKEKMKNAPFQFFPADWLGFFEARNWEPETIQYIPQESIKLNRPMPTPWWSWFFRPLLSAKTRQKWSEVSGYMILKAKK